MHVWVCVHVYVGRCACMIGCFCGCANGWVCIYDICMHGHFGVFAWMSGCVFMYGLVCGLVCVGEFACVGVCASVCECVCMCV